MRMPRTATKSSETHEDRARRMVNQDPIMRDGPKLVTLAEAAAEVGISVRSSSDTTLTFAFPPNVDPQHQPVGSLVLVQMRRQKGRVGNVLMAGETRDINRDNEQIARVVALGSLAFKNREKLTAWPEGAWAAVGDFVRVPKYGKEAWIIKLPGEEEPVIFNLVRDTDVLAIVTDPLNVVHYV